MGRRRKAGQPLPEFFPPPEAVTDFQKYVAGNVAVEPSSIPGAGNGVYWKGADPLPARRVVALYAGRIVDDMTDDLDVTEYAFTLKNSTYVCARDPATANWTRYINDPWGTGKDANLYFTDKGTVVTARRIQPGEELFVDYGPGYRDARPDTFPKRKRVRKHAPVVIGDDGDDSETKPADTLAEQ